MDNIEKLRKDANVAVSSVDKGIKNLIYYAKESMNIVERVSANLGLLRRALACSLEDVSDDQKQGLQDMVEILEGMIESADKDLHGKTHINQRDYEDLQNDMKLFTGKFMETFPTSGDN